MQSSSCGQPGVVQCSQLGPGVDQACCPQYTTCAKGYNATTTSVRCDIQELALQSLSPADKSSMGVVIEPMQSTEAQESTQSSQPAEQTSSSEAAQSVSGTQAADTSRSAEQITRMTEHTSTGAPESVSTTHTDDSPPALSRDSLDTTIIIRKQPDNRCMDRHSRRGSSGRRTPLSGRAVDLAKEASRKIASCGQRPAISTGQEARCWIARSTKGRLVRDVFKTTRDGGYQTPGAMGWCILAEGDAGQRSCRAGRQCAIMFLMT